MSNGLIIVNEFQGIIQKVDDALFSSLDSHINFQTGTASQVIKELSIADQAVTPELKSKYPLFMIQQPFPEVMGGDYYCTIKIPKIAIAYLSNATDTVPTRYNSSFIPKLYPIYYEFLKQVARWPTVVLHNQDYLPHTKLDLPGDPPPSQKDLKTGFADYLDTIIIQNLELTFQINTNCKRN